MNLAQLLLPADPVPAGLGWGCPIKLEPGMEAERVDLTGLGCEHEELAALWCLLSGRPYQPAMLDDIFPLVSENTEWGPWLYLLPDGLVAALAELPADRVRPVAEGWARSGEPPAAGPAELEPVLAAMSRLAAAARERNAVLLLWTCP